MLSFFLALATTSLAVRVLAGGGGSHVSPRLANGGDERQTYLNAVHGFRPPPAEETVKVKKHQSLRHQIKSRVTSPKKNPPSGAEPLGGPTHLI